MITAQQSPVSPVPFRRIALWSAGAVLCALLLWIPLGAAAGSLAGSGTLAKAAPAAALYVLYAPILLLAFAAVGVPYYLTIGTGWWMLCRRRPALDARPARFAGYCALFAIPVAIVASYATARIGARSDWAHAAVWFPFHLLVVWGGAVVPRALGRFVPHGFVDPTGLHE